MTENETPQRLTWEGARQAEHGAAGGIRLFSITWHSRRETPDWLMRSDLPGLFGREWKDKDKDVLKARAEELLDGWISRVNGGAK